MHGSNYWVDVLGFFHAALNIKVNRDQLVACHPLGPIKDVSNPPAFIVKFVISISRTESGAVNIFYETIRTLLIPSLLICTKD